MKALRTLATLGLVLAWAAAPAPAAGQACDEAYNNFNGPLSFYLNLHNCGAGCAAQELPYLELYKNGITGVRISPVSRVGIQPPDPEFFEPNNHDPYLRGVLEIFGPENVLVLIDDGVDEGPHAKPSPDDMARKLRSVLLLHPTVRRIEFMNEPSNFSDITPREYVGRYLPLARQVVDEFNLTREPGHEILLYSAAWFGNLDGVRETYRMVTAGGLGYVDAMSVHIYADLAEGARRQAREYKRLARGKPVAVTETNYNSSNTSSYDTQQWWLCQAMTGIEVILRRGLTPAEQELQHNVLYTLRADRQRQFNIINFPEGRSLFWQPTGPAHFVIAERSRASTDPKGGGTGEGEPGEGSGGGDGDGTGDPGTGSEPMPGEGMPRPGGRFQ